MPRDEAHELLDELIDNLEEGGFEPEDAAETGAEILEEIVNFRKLVPGPVGWILEEIDDHAFRAVADAIKKLLHPDPEAKAERQAKRAANQAARKERKAKRKADRKARKGGG